MPRKTKLPAEKTIRDIRRATRKHYLSEERITLDSPVNPCALVYTLCLRAVGDVVLR